MSLLDRLSGYKTYAAAVGAFLLAGYHLSQGDYARAQEFFVLGLGLAGLRHAIKAKGK